MATDDLPPGGLPPGAPLPTVPGAPLGPDVSPASPASGALLPAAMPPAAMPPAGPSAPQPIGPVRSSASAPTPAPAPRTTGRPWGVLGSVLFGAVCATWAVIAFVVPTATRDVIYPRVGAGLAAFLGAFGIALATVSLIRRKRAPTSIAGPWLAGLAAVSAALVAAGVAFLTRGFAADAAAHLDPGPYGPALGAYEIGQAGVVARNLAWFGFAAIPGFSLAALGLIYAHGERKEKKRLAPPGEGSPGLSLLACVVTTLLFLGGVGATIAALVAPVEVVEHPAIPRLREVRTILVAGDFATGCAGLEAVLPEKTVPRRVLELEIPDYRELATRCITARIDALPKGLPCTAAAGALLGSELTTAARAEQRVKHACDRPFD